MQESRFIVRGLEPDDFSRLVRLIQEVEAVDQTGEDVSAEAIRSFLDVPGHDPLKDRWIVENPDDPGALIAHGLLLKAPGQDDAEAAGAVHPAWRGLGLGGDLLRRTIGRARNLDARHLTVYVDDRNAVADAFIRKRGFQAVAAYTEMRATLDAPLPPSDVPQGFRMRSYDTVQDQLTLVDAMNRGYEGLWGHHVVTEEVLRAFPASLPPDGIFLAFGPEGDVVGISRVELKQHPGMGGATGYIDSPGIVRGHRDNERLRAALLVGAMRWLRDHGHTVVGLESWGDDKRTLGLYRAHGFEAVRYDTAYRLKL